MTKTLHGIARGRTIELKETLDVPEGQEIEVQVRVVLPMKPWGEGILRSAGALADDSEWDGIMDEIHRSRNVERRPQAEDQ